MYRKNVSGQHVPFVLIAAADGSALTGATVTAYRCIDGAAQASAGGSVTEKANGQYDFAPSQADTNGNNIGYLFTASGAIPVHVTIVTTAADPTDTVRFGLTALPNAAAEASGGLFTRGTGAGQITQDANGRIDVSLKAILGTTLTETAGLLAGGFKKFFNVASPTGTLNSLPDAVPGATGALPTCDSTNSVKIQTPIKRNTALNNFTFDMFTAASGALATGLTVTATRSIDGGTPAACANSVSEVTSGAGRYKINLAATDLNGTEICLHFTASGAKDLGFTLHTLP